MATSFILRNRDGSVLGYLLKREERWWACVKGDGEDAKLILFLGKKERLEFSVVCGEGEQEIGAFAQEVSGGYLMQMGHVLSYFGQITLVEAEKDAAMKRDKESKGNAKEGQCKEEGEISANLEEWHVEKNAFEQGLQRRWPPPPCMPGARYVNGIWQDSAVE